ncbi:MAG: hypothetical protein R2824_20505 [Saprospiraceae bacterium]
MTVQQILAGEKDSPLSKAIIERMLTKHRNEWGLGPSLRGEGKDLLFQHGGKMPVLPTKWSPLLIVGRRFIVMTNGDNGGRLMGEIIRALPAITVGTFVSPGGSNRQCIDRPAGKFHG